MNISTYRLWGKTTPYYMSLIGHMKLVGDVAVELLTNSAYEELIDNFMEWTGLPREKVISLVRYLAAMHDIGKATPSFQAKNGKPLPEELEDDIMPRFRHEKAVLKIAPVIWKTMDIDTKLSFAAALSLHHQGRPGGATLPTNQTWDSIWCAIEAHMRKWADFNDASVNDFQNVDAFCTILTGLIILADWIASSRDIERAFDALDIRRKETLKAFDFEEKFGKKPRPFQEDAISYFNTLEEMPLFAILEGPPSEGKSALALWLAHKMGECWNKKGEAFSLPTAATANQMVDRMREIFGDNIALHHSTAWLKDGHAEVSEEWKAPQRKGLLATNFVGTVDQLLMSALMVKYNALRLFGLTNKVVIIDEIHAYDTYMTEIIKRFLEWCKELKIPVIMLSATLPAERMKTLLSVENPSCGYPLITDMFADGRTFQHATHRVYKHMRAKIKTVYGFHNVKIPKKGMGCIIANTVSRATEIYETIEGPKILLHGRFTAALRSQIEQLIIALYGPNGKRFEKLTLVATQVVEQSLDLDFDWLITEIAPTDLIIQRIGRLHRFGSGERGIPECTVFIDAGLAGHKYGKSSIVYYDLILERTKNILNRINEINIPDDIRPLIEETYSGFEKDDKIEDFLCFAQEEQIKDTAAKMNVIKAPSKTSFGMIEESDRNDDDELTAKTRLGDGYRLCILPEKLYKDIMRFIDNNKSIPAELAKEASLYSVPISRYEHDGIKYEYDGVWGTGKLKGYKLRIGTADSPFETSVSADGYKEKLIMDKEKGLCILT